MRNILSIALLIVAIVMVADAKRHRPPTFQNPTPFNPKQPNPWGRPREFKHRLSRSADGKNQVTVEAQKQSGKSSSYNVDFGRKIYENKHGSVSVHGGMSKNPYERPQKHVGIRGEWHF